MAPAAPSDPNVSIGDIDRKVAMSLDDIIKMSKRKRQRRPQSKNRSTRFFPAQQRREAVQKSVASRSAALRQAKLAEARSRNGDYRFPVVKAATRRALSVYPSPIISRWNRKNTQAVTRPFGGTAQNIKISIPNRLNKMGGNRRPPARWAAGSLKNKIAPSRPFGGNKVPNFVGRKPQTLDSRFASLREERQLQSQYNSDVHWRK